MILSAIFYSFEADEGEDEGADCVELAIGMAMLCTGDKSSKLLYAWQVMSGEVDGCLDFASLQSYIRSFLRMLIAISFDASSHRTAETKAYARYMYMYMRMSTCRSLPVHSRPLPFTAVYCHVLVFATAARPNTHPIPPPTHATITHCHRLPITSNDAYSGMAAWVTESIMRDYADADTEVYFALALALACVRVRVRARARTPNKTQDQHQHPKPKTKPKPHHHPHLHSRPRPRCYLLPSPSDGGLR